MPDIFRELGVRTAGNSSAELLLYLTGGCCFCVYLQGADAAENANNTVCMVMRLTAMGATGIAATIAAGWLVGPMMYAWFNPGSWISYGAVGGAAYVAMPLAVGTTAANAAGLVMKGADLAYGAAVEAASSTLRYFSSKVSGWWGNSNSLVESQRLTEVIVDMQASTPYPPEQTPSAPPSSPRNRH